MTWKLSCPRLVAALLALASGCQTTDPSALADQIAPLVQANYEAPSCVAHIRAWKGNRYAAATGVLIGDGRVLTVRHVFTAPLFEGQKPTRVEVIFGGHGKHEAVNAAQGRYAVIELSNSYDLAAISKLDIPEWVKPAQMSQRPLNNGEILMSIGLESPSAVRVQLAPVVYTSGGAAGDSAIAVLAQPGDSGGPVFNERGELVGINRAIGEEFIRRMRVRQHGNTIFVQTLDTPQNRTWFVDLTKATLP